ncbi:unnamed protein product [Owenia fusiformis]|uniref:Uncharacterized protein n=1 Tax=Owenia fusiformis TaxID=6347 RepID=A0A8S4NUR2_OWEFU|nr:unnamed protein product [Owenia fusiformis]
MPKTGKTDLYRAANHILRIAVDGQLCMCMRPLGFNADKANWEQHADTQELMQQLQQYTLKTDSEESDMEVEDSSEGDGGSSDESGETESEEESQEGNIETATTRNPFALLDSD